ncbi:MAG: ABC transporter permease [Candidatus Acidiferrum sp.]|jgi:putative ABC transport system permease protein
MHGLRVFASRLLGLFRKRRLDETLDAELRAHLELLTDENIRRGMNPEEALFKARREFGGVEQIKETYRDQQSLPLLESLAQDLRYAIRMLRKNPGFTAVAVLTLALGIGANAAVFSLVDAVLLRPLPYHDPDRLVLLSETLPKQGQDELGVSAAEYFDYRDANQVFSQVAAYESAGFNLTGGATPLRVNAAALSASAFPLLGVNPILGRTFSEDEDRAGAAGVALLSSALWKSHYGADEHIVGKVIKLDEKPYTVIGVMPASFKFPFDGSPIAESADLWVPEAFSRDRLKDRTNEFGVGFIGRLKPGFTMGQAQADVESIAANFMRQYPESYPGTVRVAPRVFELSMHSVAKVRPLIFLLEGSVLCVLLIACANVASLLLAKARHRRREMAVRGALGADGARLLRQCFVESFLLSFLGGVAGIFLAVSLLAGAQRFGPVDLPQLQDLSLNARAFGFTFVLSVVTAMLFGMGPAWRMSRVSPLADMKESAQIGKMRGSQRLQNALSVAEIAIALVLLIGGGLLLQSFRRLLEVPMGFRANGAVIVRTLFDRERYSDPLKREAVQKEILFRLRALPRVSEVAAASHLPLSDIRQIGFRSEFAAADDYHWAENSLVSPGYFAAMGTPLLHGRDFSENDGRNAPRVAIVNETLARAYYPGRDSVGEHFYWGDRGIFTIIGVAADVHISALDADPPPMIYNPMFQVESGASDRSAFILRLVNSGESAAQGIFPAVRQRIWSLDKDLPLYGETTLNGLVSASVAQRRFTMLLMIGFAAISLLLAVVGLFGVISYLVAQRTRELAIRMALGADRTRVGWMILRQATALGLVGCVIGVGLFVLTSPLFAADLYHVHRFDPLTMSAMPALLLAVVILAAYVPARRATRVDPLVALRYE